MQKLRWAGSGHVYFSLADEDATIECCVWRSRDGRIAQWPTEGTLVQVHFEKVDFYGRSGRVSLHVDAILSSHAAGASRPSRSAATAATAGGDRGVAQGARGAGSADERQWGSPQVAVRKLGEGTANAWRVVPDRRRGTGEG